MKTSNRKLYKGVYPLGYTLQGKVREKKMKTKLSYLKQKKEICIGINKDNELVFINCEIGSCDNDHYTITHNTYDNIITETQGESEARDRLSNRDYWDDLGMLDENCFLHDFIDLDKVADHVIDTDGWQNTNGEYYEIGTYKDEDYYIDFSSCGANAVGALNEEYKKLLITEEEKQLPIESDKLHLKNIKTYTQEEKILLEKVLTFLETRKNETLTDKADLIPALLEEN